MPKDSLPDPLTFDWDEGNIDKSQLKHGITPKQAEEVFLDENTIIIDDIKHSQQEQRWIIIGKNFQGIILFGVFTFRRNKVRVISIRRAKKTERQSYE